MEQPELVMKFLTVLGAPLKIAKKIKTARNGRSGPMLSHDLSGLPKKKEENPVLLFLGLFVKIPRKN